MPKACEVKQRGDKNYRCFFELTLQVIGGKWKPIILYQIATDGVMRFGELKKSINGITERMLTKQLRELEKDNLIHREVYKQVPPKVEYSLKPMGVKLIPILLDMRSWGVSYEALLVKGEAYESERYENVEGPQIASIYEDQL